MPKQPAQPVVRSSLAIAPEINDLIVQMIQEAAEDDIELTRREIIEEGIKLYYERWEEQKKKNREKLKRINSRK